MYLTVGLTVKITGNELVLKVHIHWQFMQILLTNTTLCTISLIASATVVSFLLFSSMSFHF